MTWLRSRPDLSYYGLVFTTALWGLVAAVYLASRRETRGGSRSSGEASGLRP